MKNPALDLTVEQLQEALNQKIQQDKKDKELRKQAYEQIKTELVEARMKRIRILEAMIHEEHKLAMSEMEAFRDVMNEYGELPKNSKGGFSIENSQGTEKIRLRYRNLSDFDERAEMAEQKIRSFFERTLKVEDKITFEMFMSLLERKKGKIDPSKAMKILSYQDSYDDPEWLKGCELLRESFSVTGSKYYIEFEERGENNIWRTLNLNFASL